MGLLRRRLRALGALGGAPRAVHNDIGGRGRPRGLGGGARAWVASGGRAAVAVPAAAAGPALGGAGFALRLDAQRAVDHVVQPGPVAHRQVDDAILRALQHAAGEGAAARARGLQGAPRQVHHLAPASRAPRAGARLRAWPEQPGGESADLTSSCLESRGDRECPPGLPPAAEESPGRSNEVLLLLGNLLGGLESLTWGWEWEWGWARGRGTITGYGTSKVGVAPAGRATAARNSSSGHGHRAIWHHAYRRGRETRQVRWEAVGQQTRGFPGMVGVLGGWMWGHSRAVRLEVGPRFLGPLAGPGCRGAWGWAGAVGVEAAAGHG